ncbi:hypothetical protein [Streptomyces meridianus]|uniref:Integral membrane protein n=1 Tax=Streptomyces meridianus TaxID=2938945 RepID=A0ABT0X817_9ACTN|nr:hypothetical protein [Streptomyces meridianus]MCM2577862.1 hypothetical protein [Streptomyces meridianus]
MNAHAAVRPHRVRLHAEITIPVLAGLAFGAYAGWLDRNGGAATHSAIILGVVGAAVAGVLAFGIGRVQASLPREQVATLYAALFGSAVGYLNSLCGANTWLKASFIGFFVGAGMFLVANYLLLYHRKD